MEIIRPPAIDIDVADTAHNSLIHQGRNWIADCALGYPGWDTLKAGQVISIIERHYAGGWEQFVADA